MRRIRFLNRLGLELTIHDSRTRSHCQSAPFSIAKEHVLTGGSMVNDEEGAKR